MKCTLSVVEFDELDDKEVTEIIKVKMLLKHGLTSLVQTMKLLVIVFSHNIKNGVLTVNR
jgi:hypothetical protein